MELKNCNSGYTDFNSNANSVTQGGKSQEFLKQKWNACIHSLQRILIGVGVRKLILTEYNCCQGYHQAKSLTEQVTGVGVELLEYLWLAQFKRSWLFQ